MKRFTIFAALAALAIALYSCGQTGQIFMQAIGQDPQPPEDYEPVFIVESKPIEQSKFEYPKLIVSKTDPYSAQNVRHYIHLVDNDTTMLSGAAEGKWKDIWCEVTDMVNGKTHTIKDFTIREVTGGERQSQAIAMVMDQSGSMGEKRAYAVQEAVYNFINDSKKPGDMVAIVKYDDSVGVEVPLTSSDAQLKTLFKQDGLGTYGGYTATLDAIIAGVNQLKNAPPDLQRIVMVFTDGIDGESTVTKDSVVNYARLNGVNICAIDYGVQVAADFMAELAKQTQGTYNHIYGTYEFDLVFKDIYKRLEHYYVLEYAPPDFGEHNVTIKLCPPNHEEMLANTVYDNSPYAGMVTLMNVYFDHGKATLKPESNKSIQAAAALMKNNPSMVVELRGHTDSTGSSELNRKLSQSRAEAVKNALVKQGIKEWRIVPKGYGDTRPIAGNKTEAGRAKNRRTEFVIIKK